MYRNGAVIVLQNSNNLFFVGKRHDPIAGSTGWQLPQGGIDEFETELEGAYRELLEETGIQKHNAQLLKQGANSFSYEIPAEFLPKHWKGKYVGQKQTLFLFNFTGDESDIAIVNQHQEKPEFCEYKWSPWQEVMTNVVDFKYALYKYIEQEFGLR